MAQILYLAGAQMNESDLFRSHHEAWLLAIAGWVLIAVGITLGMYAPRTVCVAVLLGGLMVGMVGGTLDDWWLRRRTSVDAQRDQSP